MLQKKTNKCVNIYIRLVKLNWKRLRPNRVREVEMHKQERDIKKLESENERLREKSIAI